MKRFIEGEDRTQVTLLPTCLEDYVEAENPVRVVEVFVDGLDLGQLGLKLVNSRTASSSLSGGTATKCLAEPTSIPAAFGFARSSFNRVRCAIFGSIRKLTNVAPPRVRRHCSLPQTGCSFARTHQCRRRDPDQAPKRASIAPLNIRSSAAQRPAPYQKHHPVSSARLPPWRLLGSKADIVVCARGSTRGG